MVLTNKCFFWFGLVLIVVAGASARGQVASSQLQVLQSTTVHLSNHSVTFNRVATPTLKARAVLTPLPAALTSEIELADAGSDVFLSFSATIYDNQTTEIDWSYQGRRYVVWTNLDLDYLRSAGQFQMGNTSYSLFFSAGYARVQDVEDWNATVRQEGLSTALIQPIPVLPPALVRPDGSASYLLVSPATGGAPEALQAIADLHTFYNANRAALAQTYQESVADEAAQKQWAATHPPQAQNIIINFFPIKSSYVPANAVAPGAP